MVLINFLANIFHNNFGWNSILIVIMGCSILSVTIFFERFFHLKKSETDTNKLIIALRECIQQGNILEAIQLCEQTGGTIANIIKAGLKKQGRNKEQIENALEISGLIEIAQLEKNTKILSIIAYIAPLIGLLGTVLGFIQAFAEMRASGLADISATHIGEAMEYALITTAAGLVVAIPSVIAYNYMVSRIEGFVLEIQTTTAEIVELLTQQQDLYEI